MSSECIVKNTNECIVCTEGILTGKLHVFIIYYMQFCLQIGRYGATSYDNTKIGATSEH